MKLDNKMTDYESVGPAYGDVEAERLVEPLTDHNDSSISSTFSNTPSWKKYGMGAALVALVGYLAINSTSPFNNVSDPSSNYSVVPTLGSHHYGKSDKFEQALWEESEGDLFNETTFSTFESEGDLFNETTFSTFLPGVFGKPVMVTYHNTSGTDLFEVEPKSYIVTMADGSTVKVEGSKIPPTETAIQIRWLLGVETIDVYF